MVLSLLALAMCLQCDDLDRKCRQQQEQIFELKEQLTHLQAELKLKGSQFEGFHFHHIVV